MAQHRYKRNCKCAFMVCAHCKKDHNGPNGECMKCPPNVCRGWL